MCKFTLNQIVPLHEGPSCEFKDIRRAANRVRSITSDVGKYVVGYLNSEEIKEGSIYWGITDEGQVVGVELDRAQRDEVTKEIGGTLRQISPKIILSSYCLKLHDIFCGDSKADNRYIVEVKVSVAPSLDLYYTSSHDAFLRTGSETVRLQGEILEKEIIRRTEEKIHRKGRLDEEKTGPHDTGPVKPIEPAPLASLPNPYNTASTAKSDMFKGRDAEVDQLLDAVENGTHTAIFGLQRVGKTSLVRETLTDKIKQRSHLNCIFAEVNFHAYGRKNVTYKTILDIVVRAVAQAISPRRLEIVRAEVDELATHYQQDKDRMLEGFREIVRKLASKIAKRKIVLFLDEFSELCRAIDQNKNVSNSPPHPHAMVVDVDQMHWFSELMKSDDIEGNLVFIFAVRPFVAEYDDQEDLQLLKLTNPITLYHLDEQAAKALMTEPLSGKIDYEGGAVDYLYHLTAGHPYLIQFFLREIINRIRKERSCIKKQDIIDFEEKMISEGPAYKAQFNVLDSDYSVDSVTNNDAAKLGKGVLAVIAHLGSKQVEGWAQSEEAFELLTNHGVTDGEIYDLLSKLHQAQIIKERGTPEDNLEYRISIPLLQKRYAGQNMYQKFLRDQRKRG